MTVALVLAGAATPALQPAPLWREAPDFLTLFAPAGARSAAYRTSVSGADLDTILAAVERDSALVRTPGAWQPRAVLPADAFGQSRWTVARLYGAERPRVARGLDVRTAASSSHGRSFRRTPIRGCGIWSAERC